MRILITPAITENARVSVNLAYDWTSEEKQILLGKGLVDQPINDVELREAMQVIVKDWESILAILALVEPHAVG